MGLPIEALILAGFALAHAAWSISDAEPGELLTPLAIIESAGQRQLVRFETTSQAEAVAHGKRAMADAPKTTDAWAFAREGLMTIGSEQADVLAVDFWGRGMSQPAVLYQQFEPVSATHSFRLIGDPQVAVFGRILDSPAVGPVREQLLEGIRSHGKVAPLWADWH